jgi:hypothetical protein
MPHLSGNEDIPHSHWARDIVARCILALGLVAQFWVNLAYLAALEFPASGAETVRVETASPVFVGPVVGAALAVAATA